MGDPQGDGVGNPDNAMIRDNQKQDETKPADDMPGTHDSPSAETEEALKRAVDRARRE